MFIDETHSIQKDQTTLQLKESVQTSQRIRMRTKRICRSTLLILLLIPTLAHGAKRCKTTEDCNNPEIDEFCDQILQACMPCSDYCTGADDTIPLCMQKCPKKYSIVFGRDLPVDPVAGEPKHEKGASAKNENKLGVILGSTVGVIFVVALIALTAFFVYRKLRKVDDAEDANKNNDIEMQAMMEGTAEEKLEDAEENDTANEHKKETEIVKCTSDQADPDPPIRSEMVPSGSNAMNREKLEDTSPEYPNGNLTDTTAENPTYLQSMGGYIR